MCININVDNTVIGTSAGSAITTGEQNILVGTSAGSQITSGSRNVGVGNHALAALSVGTDNSALGWQAGFSLTTGGGNMLFGSEAGRLTTTGSYNVAIGSQALSSNTTGYQNLAFGLQSMRKNTTGYNNVGIGGATLFENLIGYNNVAIGFQSLQRNTGNENTALGNQALVYNTSGEFNSAFGERALDGNTTGDLNTGCGGETGYIQASGNNNTFVGGRAGRGVEQLITITGATAGATTVTFDFAAIGTPVEVGTTLFVSGVVPAAYDGIYTVTASSVTSVTVEAAIVDAYVSGGVINVRFDVSDNVAIGAQALYNPDTGADGNTCIGVRAGQDITTGARNVLIGFEQQADDPAGSDQINIGGQYFHDRLRLLERSSDPAEPAEGSCILWMSDGAGKGEDGDICIASNAGGVTRWAVLFEHSAGQAW